MKQLNILVILSYCLLSACREKDPEIDIGTGLKTSDTTYVATPQTPQQRNVLIEDFTGVSCPPCPNGHATLKSILAKYPGRVVITGNHIFGFGQARPNAASRQDFRTQDATDIANSFGAVAFMPSAIIDRVADASGNYIQSQASWISNVDTRISAAPPVNISITKQYNQQQRTVQARIRLNYTQAVSQPHNLTIAIIENGIIDAQETGSGIDTFYTHNDVLRDIATLTSGVPVLDSIAVKQPGRVFERSITISLDPLWNADKCRIVAFVHYSDVIERPVLQAAETSVK